MSNKGKRGKSKCKKKFLHSDQFKIEFDKNGLAKGENKSFFMSWVGLQFKKIIPNHKVVKDIDPKLYDDIWEYTKKMKSKKDHRSQEDIEVVQQNHYHVDVVPEASLEIKLLNTNSLPQSIALNPQAPQHSGDYWPVMLSAQLPIQTTHAEDVLDTQTTHTQYISKPQTTHAQNIPPPKLVKFFLILRK
ncbi:hypothetical protein E3N88_28640 [Mikania micrantha]|uniref:Uncharacterized protein n=1 Tax=Mikania micrantha TaxID=192012 RepID=A0A5N6N021_9ASTR|nr:hypothetical protein E3N88_28640 [Mikania micrantha]